MDLEAVYLWHHLPDRTEQEIPTAVREEQLHHQAVRGAERLLRVRLHPEAEGQLQQGQRTDKAQKVEAMYLHLCLIKKLLNLIILF